MTAQIQSRQPIHCSICLDQLVPVKKLCNRYEVSLKPHNIVCTCRCSHLFHRHCIESWLSKNNNCPNCRSYLSNLELIHFSNFTAMYSQYLNNIIEKKDLLPPDTQSDFSTNIYEDLETEKDYNQPLEQFVTEAERWFRLDAKPPLHENNQYDAPQLSEANIRYIDEFLRNTDFIRLN